MKLVWLCSQTIGAKTVPRSFLFDHGTNVKLEDWHYNWVLLQLIEAHQGGQQILKTLRAPENPWKPLKTPGFSLPVEKYRGKH